MNKPWEKSEMKPKWWKNLVCFCLPSSLPLLNIYSIIPLIRTSPKCDLLCGSNHKSQFERSSSPFQSGDPLLQEWISVWLFDCEEKEITIGDPLENGSRYCCWYSGNFILFSLYFNRILILNFILASPSRECDPSRYCNPKYSCWGTLW